jgi:hypothetical protein
MADGDGYDAPLPSACRGVECLECSDICGDSARSLLTAKLGTGSCSGWTPGSPIGPPFVFNILPIPMISPGVGDFDIVFHMNLWRAKHSIEQVAYSAAVD